MALAATLVQSFENSDGNPVSMEIRPADGYVNATKLCQAANKAFADYARLGNTSRFLKALEAKMGIPMLELIQSEQGGSHVGTWVHPRVAVHLAQWCSPEFAVAVTDLVLNYMMGRVTTEDSLTEARAAIEHPSMVMPDRSRVYDWSMNDKAYVHLYRGVPGIYIGQISEDMIKPGSTNDIDSRLRSHRAIFHRLGYGFELVRFFPTDNPSIVENQLKMSPEYRSRRVVDFDNGHGGTAEEVLQLTPSFGIHAFTALIQDLIRKNEPAYIEAFQQRIDAVRDSTASHIDTLQLEKLRLEVEKDRLQLQFKLDRDRMMYKYELDLATIQARMSSVRNEGTTTTTSEDNNAGAIDVSHVDDVTNNGFDDHSQTPTRITSVGGFVEQFLEFGQHLDRTHDPVRSFKLKRIDAHRLYNENAVTEIGRQNFNTDLHTILDARGAKFAESMGSIYVGVRIKLEHDPAIISLRSFLQRTCVFDESYRLSKAELIDKYARSEDTDVSRSWIGATMAYLGHPFVDVNYVGLRWRDSMTMDDAVRHFRASRIVEDRLKKTSRTEMRAAFKSFVDTSGWSLHWMADDLFSSLANLYGYTTIGEGPKRNKQVFIGLGLTDE